MWTPQLASNPRGGFRRVSIYACMFWKKTCHIYFESTSSVKALVFSISLNNDYDASFSQPVNRCTRSCFMGSLLHPDDWGDKAVDTRCNMLVIPIPWLIFEGLAQWASMIGWPFSMLKIPIQIEFDISAFWIARISMKSIAPGFSS